MSQPSKPGSHLPIILLLLVQLVIGLFTFRDYGLAWDEPLFYEYADALGYAYTPSNWFDPGFDLSRAYGPSGDDHKTRGPAYLLLAREPVHALQALGLEQASAWHLVNFLAFLLGVYLLYRLSLRWMSPWAAFGAAALFSMQPLLWGHAFINPKDVPFMVFFTGAILFGFEMVDSFYREDAKNAKEGKRKEHTIGRVLLAAFFLGIATSIRVLGPLAGVLVLTYFFVGRIANPPERDTIPLHKGIRGLLLYGVIAILVMLASWPYLWEAPISRFIEVFGFMSENPTGLQVLFGGEIFHAYELPRQYLPTLLAITLTEPVWILFILGLGIILWNTIQSFRMRTAKSSQSTLQVPDFASKVGRLWTPSTNSQSLNTDYWLLITAFLIPFAYVILRRPPMYDGFRHFLFILPPVFVTCGLGLEKIYEALQTLALQLRSQFAVTLFRAANPKFWLRAVIIICLLLPGLVGLAQLHPYEYTYYNSLTGGTGGAFRNYETDYWLTCYKETVEQFNVIAPRPASLFVHREAYIAATYAANGMSILDERGNLSAIRSGDYILVNTRSNEDRKTFHDAPVVIEVGRGGAIFCVIKQIP
jgi:hypothetical protein